MRVKAILSIIIATHSLISLAEPRLELSSELRTTRKDRTILVQLQIKEVEGIAEQTECFDSEFFFAPIFSCYIPITPKNIGELKLGPYELEINGDKLVSNQISINVISPWDGRFGTFFRVDKQSIKLGESIQLIRESWSNKDDNKDIQIKETSSSYTCGYISSSGGPGKEPTTGIEVHRYRTIWLITPKEKGCFQISKEMFMNLPEGIVIPNITVTVE